MIEFIGFLVFQSVSANSYFIIQNLYEKRIKNLGPWNELAIVHVRPSGHS